MKVDTDDKYRDVLYKISRRDHINKILNVIQTDAYATQHRDGLLRWFLLCCSTISEDELNEQPWERAMS